MQLVPYTIDTPAGPKVVHTMRYPDREIWIICDEIKRGILRRVEAQHALYEGMRKTADDDTLVWIPMTNAIAKMLDAQNDIFPPGNVFVHWHKANGPADMPGYNITAALFPPMVENMLDRMFSPRPIDLSRYGAGQTVPHNENAVAQYLAELSTN